MIEVVVDAQSQPLVSSPPVSYFIGVNMAPSKTKLLYLSQRDLRDIDLPMERIVEIVDQVFQEKGRRQVEMPPKPGVHPRKDSSIRAMLAYIPSMDAAGVKWISGYGRNYIAGIPNINGLVILNDTETGRPKTVMDCTWITSMRTGAATAVAAKYLARPQSSSIGVIACGALARTNLKALIPLFSLEKVVAYDLKPEQTESFAKDIRAQYGIEVIAAKKIRQAVEEMDLIVTSGSILQRPKPLIRAEWIAPGSFSCALDFDASFTPEAFALANHLVTDDLPQFDYFRGSGYFRKTPEPHSDLGRIAAGQRKGRRSERSRTMAILMGIGILDIAVGSVIDEVAREMGIGTELPF